MAESLEKVDKNRKEFISNVSHELRSPITSIKGFVAGILDGIIPKDKEDYYLKIVSGEIDRLSRLVGELLDISALENGKFNLKKTRLDINEVIKLCLGNLEGTIIEKDRRVEVLLDAEYQYVYADRDRIIQVLTNILDNALKYGKKGGYIKIDITNKGDKVNISIHNEGPELKKEELIKIWDRFYKADKSRTNKDSTGLGMPIVRLILTQHGEDIWVNNEKDGVTFTFTLQRD
jgi:signal transduction histidine kinase